MSNSAGKSYSTWADLDTSCSSEDESLEPEQGYEFLTKNDFGSARIDEKGNCLISKSFKPSSIPKFERTKLFDETEEGMENVQECKPPLSLLEFQKLCIQPSKDFLVMQDETQACPIRSVNVGLNESSLCGPMIENAEIKGKKLSVETNKLDHDALSVSCQECGDCARVTPMIYNVSQSVPTLTDNAQQTRGEVDQKPYVPATTDLHYQNPSTVFPKCDERKKGTWVDCSGKNCSRPYRPTSFHSRSLPLQSTRKNGLNLDKYSFGVPDMPPYCIWMGNMPASATHREIILYFRDLGIVLKDIRFGRIHINMFTCAYVDFHTRQDMVHALIRIDKPRPPLFMGRRLDIDINEGIQVDRRAAVNVSKLPAVYNDHRSSSRMKPKPRFKKDGFLNANQQPGQAHSSKSKRKKSSLQRMNFESRFFN